MIPELPVLLRLFRASTSVVASMAEAGGYLRPCVFAAITVCFILSPVAGQHMLDPSDAKTPEYAERIDKILDPESDQSELSCHVRKIDPAMNFAFRWYTGFRVRFPLAQFRPEPARLRAVFRVRSGHPDAPFYFWEDFTIPGGPRLPEQRGEISGGLFISEGKYAIDWALMDEAGRVCREQWDFKLKMDKNERRVSQFVEPGAVSPIVIRWESTADGPPRPYRIAVVLHVAPVFPRSIRMSGFDQSLLATVLTSLFEQTPFRATTVYAVNLERAQLLYETSELDRSSFSDLIDSFEELQLGTIDAEDYWDRDGGAKLIGRIVSRETASDPPPDAIVFIGPNNGQTARVPDELVESAAAQNPLFYYLHLDYYQRRFPWDDTIERLIDDYPGKVFRLRHPKHLAKALRVIAEKLAERRQADS